jgi:hypothetical protein
MAAVTWNEAARRDLYETLPQCKQQRVRRQRRMAGMQFGSCQLPQCLRL